ncbi:pyridoxamine 5'-phosphate oxidase family protein [Christensenellaceae bacterium OttesenSCG-928-L17]|nr:pyridoxamine 5'-phosphate oxidase family protein [Christensenellaceae bacterium OttesenSCG-928-L17]
MIAYEPILAANPNGVLATQDGGEVKTRVFQYLFTQGGNVYFCTSNEKPVYAQLRANPSVSFCTYPEDFAPVLSINGKAVFVNDLALKARALNENPGIKGIYSTPDNPVFELFYIAVEEVETFSFAEGPQTYRVEQ